MKEEIALYSERVAEYFPSLFKIYFLGGVAVFTLTAFIKLVSLHNGVDYDVVLAGTIIISVLAALFTRDLFVSLLYACIYKIEFVLLTKAAVFNAEDGNVFISTFKVLVIIILTSIVGYLVSYVLNCFARYTRKNWL